MKKKICFDFFQLFLRHPLDLSLAQEEDLLLVQEEDLLLAQEEDGLLVQEEDLLLAKLLMLSYCRAPDFAGIALSKRG